MSDDGVLSLHLFEGLYAKHSDTIRKARESRAELKRAIRRLVIERGSGYTSREVFRDIIASQPRVEFWESPWRIFDEVVREVEEVESVQ